MIHQCNECKKWNACPGALPWFPPAVIRFCPTQIEWLLDNLVELKEGSWPNDPQDTGYLDLPRAQRVGTDAYFVTPVTIAAEIEVRLERCGKDGLLTRQCKALGWDELTLAELMGMGLHQIERRVRRVINYCSGYRRKQVTYSEYVQRRRIPAKHQNAGME